MQGDRFIELESSIIKPNKALHKHIVWCKTVFVSRVRPILIFKKAVEKQFRMNNSLSRNKKTLTTGFWKENTFIEWQTNIL